MDPRSLPIALLALLLACTGKDDDGGNPDGPAGDADADTDADADSDADADADADSDADTDTGPVVERTTPTNGGGVALTADSTVAVVANRTAGEITVVDLDLAAVPATGAIRVTFNEGDAEPFAAVLSTDETMAFVILREAQEVVRIDDPKGSASLHPVRAATDAEPSGLAISPNGTTLYVANWNAGNVTVVDTATMDAHTVDLNQALVDTGVLGPSVTAGRPGLARPYAIVVTDDGDGDDGDETVYVTEFFGQDDPAAAFVDDTFFDTNKMGFVYAFDTATETVGAPIRLGSSPDMGFVDSNGVVAGCSPNALYAMALDGPRLYVAGMCASPRGPQAPGAVDTTANFRTKVGPVLYVVDTTAGAEIEAERLHLNRLWADEYDATGVPDDGSRRFPLIVNGLGFVPGTHILYMTAYGADAVFRLELDNSGQVFQVGSGLNDFVNLSATPNVGRLPYGIAVDASGNAVVVNEHSRNLSVLDLGTQSVEAVVASASPIDPADTLAVDENDGRRFFVTGMGRWSFSGQGWNSCEGCHPHGLSDNVTWFFAAGPRQSTSLDGTYAPDGTHRLLNWTAIFDEVLDFEANTRGISGGVGAIVWDNTGSVVNDDRIVFDGAAITGSQQATDTLQAGLNGSTTELVEIGVLGHDVAGNPLLVQSVLEDWVKIDRYVESIRSPRAPALDAAAVADGEALFVTHGCGGCHGGPLFTVGERFYTPSQATNDAATGTLGTTSYSRGTLPVGLNPAADNGGGSAFLRAGGVMQCALRGVGTFPASGNVGVAPAGVVVSERKEDMATTATGSLGFNPPSLLGVAAGAPFFHAGNARTLEEVLDPTFLSHYRAFSANFSPSPGDVADLVAYLQSIDDGSAAQSTAVGAFDTVLCE